MKKITITSLLSLLVIFACSKKEVIPSEPPPVPEQWKKFIGDYKVYDTLGGYLYDISIEHLSITYLQNGQKIDSLIS